jgi:hypothetical protein
MSRSGSSAEADAIFPPAEALDLESPAAAAGCVALAVPPGFLKPGGRLQQRIDRALGYFGQSRFVFFYFEPRGEEVVWNDGHSYGFATGGWRVFGERVLPLAHGQGVNVGQTGGRADHVLLIDRITGQAYFAPREAAAEWVAEQARSPRLTA